MPNTFELIASYNATGAVSSIVFSSIPSTYTDLAIDLSARISTAGVSQSVVIKFNSITTGYSSRNLFGSGSSVASNSSSDGYIGEMATGSSATASTFGSGFIYIPNYAGSTNKSYSADWVTENNATAAYAGFTAGLMTNTAAINAVTLTGNFIANTTAYIYGVKNA
jgi:hypothetical protein